MLGELNFLAGGQLACPGSSLVEYVMLDALDAFKTPLVESFSIRTPRLYLFDRKTDTQVLEDLADTIDVKTVLESPKAWLYYLRLFQLPWATLWGLAPGPGSGLSTRGFQTRLRSTIKRSWPVIRLCEK